MKRSSTLLLLPLALTAALFATASAAVSTVSLVSVNRTGAGSANGPAGLSRVSPNGRYVLFASRASNLVANDANGISDVYVRDTMTGVTTLVSVNSAGTGSGNGASTDAQISADGRYVVFESNASDLVPNDTNGAVLDVFVRDLVQNTTSLLSVNATGTGSGNGQSFDPVICLDGSTIAFESEASDLVPNDTNAKSDIFIRRAGSPTTIRLSTDSTGTVNANGASWDPVMSQDGQMVAFESDANNLVAGDLNNTQDVFVRNLSTGATAIASINMAGTGAGNGSAFDPSISMDGQRVVFGAAASNLVPGDTNGQRDVFVRDLAANSTILVSVNRFGTGSGNGDAPHAARISADGSTVVFTNTSSDLVANDTNGAIEDVFVRNLSTGVTSLASINAAGTGSGNGPSAVDVQISADGRYVAFDSQAGDLVPNDANDDGDIFVRDVVAGTTTLASASSTGTGSGNGLSFNPRLSLSGRFVSFDSGASDLVARDGNFSQDVFVAFINTAPTAGADSYTTPQGVTLNVPAPGVLGNDGDVERDSLAATLVTGPANGTLNLALNGGFTYTPKSGFTGTDSFTYVAGDGAASSAPATVTINVTGGTPTGIVANAGADQKLEAKGTKTSVSLDGSRSTGPSGKTLTYEWFEGNTRIATGKNATVSLTLGVHKITLKVSASGVTPATDEVVITIVDTTAPTITGILTLPSVLTKPDGKLRPVVLLYLPRDAVDSRPSVTLTVTSNEPVTRPDRKDASDSTSPDWTVVNPLLANLRAESSSRGNGRVYTLTVTVRDASGNQATKSTTVSVPKQSASSQKVAAKASTAKAKAKAKAKGKGKK